MVVLRLDDVYTGARDSASFCVYSKSFIVQSLKREKQGRLGSAVVKASAFGSGRDPGVLGSSPTSGSSAGSLLLPLSLSCCVPSLAGCLSL